MRGRRIQPAVLKYYSITIITTMKKIIFGASVSAVLLIMSCNNAGSDSKAHLHKTGTKTADSMAVTPVPDEDVKTVTVTYANVDKTAAASIDEIISRYLHIKNALTADNGGEAAKGAEAMAAALGKLDKSFLTASQKKDYDFIENELKDDVKQVAVNGKKIAQQRAHFATISEQVHQLVEKFGTNRPIYYDFCPMARDNEGAYWVSEMKEVKNPYFGASMLGCGTVKELVPAAF
jgi:hypothetical protein